MTPIATILHLDDDPGILLDVRTYLEQNGYVVRTATTAEKAEKIVVAETIHGAIVDLFLEGDDGEELSNDFIRAHLHPRNIPYGRLTSAPGLVPKDVQGSWILPKAYFRRGPTLLLDRIVAMLP